MGWATGSELVERIAEKVFEAVEDEEIRREIYDVLVDAVLDMDCDTLDECRGIDPVLDDCINEKWASDEFDDED